MKKISILIATLVLFAGISFATSYQAKPADKTKTDKKVYKKTEKKDVKKVPVRKTVTKPKTATNTTNTAK